MIQDFNPRARESNQYGGYAETNTQDQDHTACSTPNPPWWCQNQPPSVNIDAYIPILLLVAIVVALIKLRNFKIKKE